jgi:hypothetical protein
MTTAALAPIDTGFEGPSVGTLHNVRARSVSASSLTRSNSRRHERLRCCPFVERPDRFGIRTIHAYMEYVKHLLLPSDPFLRILLTMVRDNLRRLAIQLSQREIFFIVAAANPMLTRSRDSAS